MKKLMVIVLLLISGLSIYGQNQKIGYVDSQVLYQNYAPAIKAQQDLQTLQQDWARTRDSLNSNISTKCSSLSKSKCYDDPSKETRNRTKINDGSKPNSSTKNKLVIQKGQK